MSLLDLHSVLEKILQGFLVFDKDFHLVSANEKGIRIFSQGTELEEIRGKHIFELSPTLEGSQRFEEYKKVMQTGKAFMAEKALYNKYFMVRAQKLSSEHFAMFLQEFPEAETPPQP